MTCSVTLPAVVQEDGALDVIGKFKEITEASLATDSIYMRAKDTFKELFDAKKIQETDYANLASAFISQLASTTTQSAMTLAIEWAKQEKEMAYSLAQLKAQTNLALAQYEKVKHDICLTDKENDLKCAQITATIAGSIRDNGRVATYDPVNTCMPLTLQDEGTKYRQELAIAAQEYASLADTYRKSGIVALGVDTDGERKGLSGDIAGYTNAQESFARRQIKSFEDSKRSHAANATSQMIGQLLASEVAPDPAYVAQWNAAISYLNTNTP